MAKPKNQTKRHNYLLRSAHTESLIMIAVAAANGRISFDGAGYATVLNAAGRWVGNCDWAYGALRKHGLTASDVTGEVGHRETIVRLTDAGRDALAGALAVEAIEGRQRAERCGAPIPVVLDEAYWLAKIDGRGIETGERGHNSRTYEPKHCTRHGWHVGNVPCPACEAANDAARHEAYLDELEQRPGIAIEPAPTASDDESANWIKVGSVVEIETADVERVARFETVRDMRDGGVAAVMGRVVDVDSASVRVDVIDWPDACGWYGWSIVKPVSATVAEHYAQVERDRAAKAGHIARGIVEPRNDGRAPAVDPFAEYERIIAARAALAPGNATGLARSYADEADYWRYLAQSADRPHVAIAFRLAAKAARAAREDILRPITQRAVRPMRPCMNCGARECEAGEPICNACAG